MLAYNMLYYWCVKKYTVRFLKMLLSAKNYTLTLGDDNNGFSR
jgi:hypothetical protein